jgi:twinkle protein
MKLRNLATAKDERRFARTKGSASGLFNIDGIKDRKRVVLVEGELDAVAIWQSGVTEVCSTSLGAKKEIPVEWREALQAADDIVLWYDDDDAGAAASQVLVEGLGVHRVRLASIPEGVAAAAEKVIGKHPKDAADLIAAGVDASVIQAIVANAKAMHTANVVQPSSYAEYLAAQIDKGAEVLGTPTGWASIDRLMRGIRPCEVTLVTGHTGHGKTTWTTDLLENLAKQGVPVLLSALEDGPELLVTRLFQRQYGRPISSIVTEADRQRAHDVIARLDANPVYLIDAYGRASKQELFDAIRYAVVRLGVLFVGIDHVHFVRKDDPRQDDREHLDAFMMDLVALAMELRIHVFLIAHPRGGVELSVIPTGEHVKGSSTMKQVAQNGISVYRADEGLEIGGRGDGRIRITDAQGRRVEMTLAADQSIVYVWKCRHPDAKQGAAMLRFDGRCLSFREDMPPAVSSRTEVDSPFVADDAWGSTSFGA